MSSAAMDNPEPRQGEDVTYQHMVKEVAPLGESEIYQTFADATVFVTGGTGFLGKLLVEKLLRSCADVKKIYLLARPKKGKSTAERLIEQFSDVLYDKLCREQPNFSKKVAIIEGDVGELGMGISSVDRQTLMQEVEIIFHGAATVRFDEALKKAVEVNVRGTREMLLLARNCPKLKAFIHISTAYSNCILREIDEKFYEISMDVDQLIELVEKSDDMEANSMAAGILGDYPNTYAYTKSAAETIILKYSYGLPVAVIRPAIVVSTDKEPIAGWIDNVYGPTGVVAGVAGGLIHALHCHDDAIAELVPGDMVVNASIACAWKTAKDFRNPKNREISPLPDQPPPVYNYVSSEQKPLTWDTFMTLNLKHGFNSGNTKAVYYCVFYMISSLHMYKFACLVLHWIPAYIGDWAAVIIGKEPVLKKTYTKIYKFTQVIAYFCTREWKFYNRNTQRLYEEMSDADKKIFDFDISHLEWNTYFFHYMRGIRTYIFKEPMENMEKGRKHFLKLKMLHFLVCTVLGVIGLALTWIILKIVSGGLSLVF